jgi:hypothetical protein
LVDIFSIPAVQEEGLVVVELFSGISATTEALLRAGVKIKKLYCCEIDPKVRVVIKSRASNWLQVFPELLQSAALEGFHSFLPQNVELIGNSHVLAMEKPDLIVAGFPCQGFSRASGQARGVADPRTHLFMEALHVIHLIHRRCGHCGWLIENVDATDHPFNSVRRDFNEVVKRLMGEGVAYDAISVGWYAHRYWRYWRNLIPGPLLHEMWKNRFLMRSVDQQVQDVLEPGRFAQTCQHNRAPGPHTVNIPGRPLKAFATFVTIADSHAYSAEGQSLVLWAEGFSAPIAVERETAMGFMRGTTLLDLPNSKAKRGRLLGGTIDLFAMTFWLVRQRPFRQKFLQSDRGARPLTRVRGGHKVDA